MGCNCGGSAAKQYQYVAPNGQVTTYKTEVEARAAKLRNGNSGEVRTI
jgi:hypothetical protein